MKKFFQVRNKRTFAILISMLILSLLVALPAAAQVNDQTTYYYLTTAATTGGSVTDPASSNSFYAGQVISVEATPDSGYRFVNWTSAVTSGTGSAGSFADSTSATTTYTMPANAATITANFEAVKALTFTTPTKGAFGPLTSPAGNYAEGEQITLQAVPADGYLLSAFTVTESDTTTITPTVDPLDSNIYTFKMPALATNVTAAFEQGYTLTASAADENGKIMGDPEGTYKVGYTVSLNALPVTTGYTFEKWTITVGSTVTTSTSPSYSYIMTAANVDFVASFVAGPPYQTSYALTLGTPVATQGSFDTTATTKAGSYLQNTEITVQAIPATGYAFDKWSIVDSTGADVTPIYLESTNISSNPAKFLMPASAVTVTPTFAQTYNLVIQTKPAAGGSIIGEERYSLKETEKITLRAMANDGYYFSGWTDSAGAYPNGFIIPDPSKATTKLIMPANAYTAVATFTLGTTPTNLLTVVSANTTMGVIDSTSDQTGQYKENRTIHLVATPKTGYEFVNWVTNNADVEIDDPTESSASFYMPGSAAKVTAYFKAAATPDTYTVNVTVSPANTGTVNNTATADPVSGVAGTSVELKATADTGWSFDHWAADTVTISEADSKTNPLTINIPDPGQNVAVTATFTQTPVTSTYPVTATPNNATYGTCSFTPASPCTVGATVTLNANPNTGYQFVNWTSADAVTFASSTASNTTFTMPANKVDAVCNFSAIPVSTYTVTATSNNTAYGSCTVSPLPGPYSAGTAITVTAVANSGYKFDNWTSADVTLITPLVSPLRFSMPAKNVAVACNFSAVTIPVGPIDFIPVGRFFDDHHRLPGTGFSTKHFTALSAQPKALSYADLNYQISIPSLNVESNMVEVPTENDSWAVEWLGKNIGLLQGSAKPGEGIAYAAGHNHLNNTETGPFLALGSLEENDRIFVTGADGVMHSFKVFENDLFLADDGAAVEEIAASHTNTLVLITCENESIEGGYTHRRVVFAEPI